MNKITYNKLVRDNVPEIIEKAGKVCNTRILNDEDYFDCLVNKLSEEMSEFLAAFSIEELADIQEVVNAIAKAKGYPSQFRYTSILNNALVSLSCNESTLLELFDELTR